MDFNVYDYNYNDRVGNQNIKALGKVKSEKYFPLFKEDGQIMIFKPLSKTKPFLTPLFAYSEVYWSNIIQRYFDEKAPIYRLAICHGYSKDIPKYRDRGTIVPKIDGENERLVNLLEFFRENKDENVNIENYTNYCGVFYDYTNILESDFFQENKTLAKELAYQILLSILKGDINYHYENVAILYRSGKPVSIAPPIDHEFSIMFYCLDYLSEHIFYMSKLLDGINFEASEDYTKSINISKNLDYIIDNYPDVVKLFLNNLKILKEDLKYNGERISNDKYIEPFDSYEFMVGIKRYKEKDERKADILERKIERVDVDLPKFSKGLNEEVLTIIDGLEKTLSKRLNGKRISKSLTKLSN